jgi:immune inhibitor A
MQRKTLVVFGLLFVTIFLLTVSVGAAMTDPGKDTVADSRAPKVDNRMHPAKENQVANQEKAMEAKLNGKAKGNTHAVAKGQYVELEREGEDPVWTVMGEFSDYAHNSIVEPDRSVDNTTIWAEDFSRDYYLEMLFAEGEDVNSMRQFYIENSSNRYTVYGDVTDWVPLEGVACDYDDGDPGPGSAYHVWDFLIESIDGWYDMQIAAGVPEDDINAYLADFDVWDRYDYDGDGDFNEPDGYIDHMQFVHAGEGNEAGGGALGDCAIWSHSWGTYWWLPVGPDFNVSGGIQVGDSDFWVLDYTIQPENGGVGVFAHEFGHDLGLPDLYDYTGENGTGFWTVMSSGSWLSQNDYDIGSQPNHFGVWEKFQLGWLNYEVAFAGEKSEHKMGPAEANTKQAQGLFVVLPPKEVVADIGPPFAGEYYYYSGAGDNLDNYMYKAVSVGAGQTLTAKVNYQIELNWDYAYLVMSTDNGTTWTTIPTNFGDGITGSSGGWVDLTADLPAGDYLLGFNYWTDGNTGGFGFKLDDLVIADLPLDGAETDAGWTFDGFRVTSGVEAAFFSNYYVAEYRQYRGFDAGLSNAYNFGFIGVPGMGNYVERFPYQDGLLISYWDNSFANNNVGANCAAGRCGGLLLPVDAHPEVMYDAFDNVWRGRTQTYDATFGLEATDAITLHKFGEPSYHPSLPAVPIFDDNISYYRAENPMGSVITPQTGTQIRVKSVSAQGSFMQVEVRPSK